MNHCIDAIIFTVCVHWSKGKSLLSWSLCFSIIPTRKARLASIASCLKERYHVLHSRILIFGDAEAVCWCACITRVSSLEFVRSPGAIHGEPGTHTVQERRAPRMAYMQHPMVSSEIWFSPYDSTDMLYGICSDYEASEIIDWKIFSIC